MSIAILSFVNSMLMVAAMAMIIFYVPVDADMGITQKLFYIHLPSAFACFIAVAIMFGSSLKILFKPTRRVDHIACACGEVGWLFCTITLITGMIWARQAWSVWWVWDPRLTSFLVLWCILSVYLILRGSVDDGMVRTKLCAAFGILAFLDVPLVFFSIHWFNAMHPAVIKADEARMDDSMLLTLIVSSVAIVMLAALFIAVRYKILVMEKRLTDMIHNLGESICRQDRELGK